MCRTNRYKKAKGGKNLGATSEGAAQITNTMNLMSYNCNPLIKTVLN